ncbi:MAG: M20/M25/M40 family metallo-hydrolase [Polyangiaceae bacterium]
MSDSLGLQRTARRPGILLAIAALALAGGGSGARPEGEAHGAPSASATASARPSASASVAPPEPGWADAYAGTAARILESARADSGAFEKLRYLTDHIGNRLSGSPALDRATKWAAETMTADGHENVRREKVMVPHWERGEESAVVTLPERRNLVMLGLGGSVGTPKEGIEGDVVVVHDFDELDRRADEVKDHIVLYDVAMPAFDHEKGSGYGDVVKYRTQGASRAANHGARAALVRSVTARSLRTPHTGAMRYDEKLPKIPIAAVTVEDATWITRLVAGGETVHLKLTMGARTLPDAESANVVGELVGSELPKEIVVIGGHIDSWDVGQGAHDDGAGCVMMMQALTTLRRLGLTPRRTIRVVLFTNEENGLKGGTAYDEAHGGEVHVAALEADSGGFAPRGLFVEAPKPALDRVLARVNSVAALLAPVGDPTSGVRVKAEFSGADLIPLVKRGFVGIGLETDGELYFDYHHSQADTLDKVDPKSLADDVAAAAITAFVLADHPGTLVDP